MSNIEKKNLKKFVCVGGDNQFYMKPVSYIGFRDNFSCIQICKKANNGQRVNWLLKNIWYYKNRPHQCPEILMHCSWVWRYDVCKWSVSNAHCRIINSGSTDTWFRSCTFSAKRDIIMWRLFISECFYVLFRHKDAIRFNFGRKLMRVSIIEWNWNGNELWSVSNSHAYVQFYEFYRALFDWLWPMMFFQKCFDATANAKWKKLILADLRSIRQYQRGLGMCHISVSSTPNLYFCIFSLIIHLFS